MTEDLVQKVLETKALEEVAGLTGAEEAIAAANFRRVGAKGEKIADDLWSLAVMALLDPSPTSAQVD
jgi:hypothetical protein